MHQFGSASKKAVRQLKFKAKLWWSLIFPGSSQEKDPNVLPFLFALILTFYIVYTSSKCWYIDKGKDLQARDNPRRCTKVYLRFRDKLDVEWPVSFLSSMHESILAFQGQIKVCWMTFCFWSIIIHQENFFRYSCHKPWWNLRLYIWPPSLL